MTNPRCYSYIRFSTPDQIKGASLARQIDLSKQYAEKHGLILDDIRDEGLSAFKGEHRAKGALGRFLKLVNQGEIPKGSVLIVESLDRLTREACLDALGIFTDIIKQGIKIVTLTDGMEYSKETINANIGQLMMSLVIMSRAHEESMIKAKRLKDAWERKRANIDEKKLTSRCPAWLKLSDDRKAFVLINDRCEVVKSIYDMKLNGIGAEQIARIFNTQSPPLTWMPTNGWRKSYVTKILHNPAVIGEFQMHEKRPDGKKVPIGSPVKDYFPQIVSTKKFYQVQTQFKRNQGKGGRTGKVRNLFSHLAKCGYCGAPMQFVDKGKPPKGGRYLVCDNARRGLGCEKKSSRYEIIEEIVLTYCKGLDVEGILSNREEKKSMLFRFKDELDQLIIQSQENEKEIENLAKTISRTSDTRISILLEDTLSKALTRKEKLSAEILSSETTIGRLINSDKEEKNNLDSIRFLAEKISEDESNDSLLRLRLRQELRRLIEKIRIYTNGYKHYFHKPYLVIEFKGGDYRILSLNAKFNLRADYSKELERIVYVDANTGEIDVCLTNDLD